MAQDIDSMIDSYEQLINPNNFIHCFDTLEEFKDWANLGTPEEIDWAIAAFEKTELFVHCSILKNVKENKQNKR